MATKNAVVEQVSDSKPPRSLFIKVNTYDQDGREVGTRIVDIYHFGTSKWMQNHQWWAAHNHNTVETNNATDEEVSAYLQAQKAALAEKFNHEKAHQAA